MNVTFKIRPAEEVPGRCLGCRTPTSRMVQVIGGPHDGQHALHCGSDTCNERIALTYSQWPAAATNSSGGVDAPLTG